METCEVAARSQTLAIEALEVGIEGTFTRPVLRCVFACVLFLPRLLKTPSQSLARFQVPGRAS